MNLVTEKINLAKNKKPQKADDFPYIEVSKLALRESFRKELNRPIYHIHKWWAVRLGSVFRSILMNSLKPQGFAVWNDFYSSEHKLKGKVVLDPFMGSGTTIGEAIKLGAKPIGCDINPISTFAVSQALTNISVERLEKEFKKIESDIKSDLLKYYMTDSEESDEKSTALYYFWVNIAETPKGEQIPLFKNYIFSKNAYPKKKPLAKIICPVCWKLIEGTYNQAECRCSCGHEFNPQKGPVNGQYVEDSDGNKYKIRELLPKDGRTFERKMYAIFAQDKDGKKFYKKPSHHDLNLFDEIKEILNNARGLPLPKATIESGHNTDQAIGYNFTEWKDLFNERQLLVLGTLLKRIMKIDDVQVRRHFLCLFSSTLEFNNIFCSFKGEGTGAVRHIFSHHILKPERTPLENNVWGTSRSSGSFSSLFKSRLLKAKEYLENPFELQITNEDVTKKVTVSKPIDVHVTDSWDEYASRPDCALVLNGSSDKLPIPNNCVDTIVTDPPYFDFIHYSELSDFFYAWLKGPLKDELEYFANGNSRNKKEVQSKDPNEFSEKLRKVFKECSRVLKDNGTMSFSFHHSKEYGWEAIFKAITEAGFYVVSAIPVYGEMSGTTPKNGTKEPISLDVILICSKIPVYKISDYSQTKAEYVKELSINDFKLSKSDIFNIEMGLSLVKNSLTKRTKFENIFTT